MGAILIADSGSTKCEWCLIDAQKQKKYLTGGISPYFLNSDDIVALLTKELLPKLKQADVSQVFFYGTGLKDDNNKRLLTSSLKKLFSNAYIETQTDLLGAARALCKAEKGVAAILGTGCNSCYYDGKKVAKNSPGIGYILGDEGAGSYLGKKVIQHFLYKTFDDELMLAFSQKYNIREEEILDNVYKKPLPNRYLASFCMFLTEHRNHYMIANIIEDGLNDFFFTHLKSYRESFVYPVHFTGSVAFGFKDVIETLCSNYTMQPGLILKQPIDGLIEYHLQT